MHVLLISVVYCCIIYQCGPLNVCCITYQCGSPYACIIYQCVSGNVCKLVIYDIKSLSGAIIITSF